MKLKKLLIPFFKSIPKLLLFQLVSSFLVQLCAWGISELSNLILGTAGKTSVSSGDFAFVFTHWQGYAVIALMIVIVLLYVAADVNALIIYCGELIDGREPRIFKCLWKGLLALKKYLDPRGAVVIIYLTLISPIIGLGFSISLTKNFYIPKFISSVIYGNPLMTVGMYVLFGFFFLVGIVYCFILHGTLLDGKRMKEASVESRRLIKSNWKNFLFEMFRFLMIMLAFYLLIAVVFLVVPQLVFRLIPGGKESLSLLRIILLMIGAAMLLILNMLGSSFIVIKIDLLRRRYKSSGEWEYKPAPKKRHPAVIAGAALLLCVVLVMSLLLWFSYENNILIFENKVGITAHRAGGTEAPENTVKGIETAASLGASGAEIDIQRTSDGYYVVNHDDSFKRVAGVDQKPSELTLEEVRRLRVDGEPVPTLEETLEASRDRLRLFVELKGETADSKMADDAVRIIKEAGMEKQTVLISLKYDVLEYIERKYPEIETGYLAFFSFGKMEKMPFDYFALEEEIATSEAIDNIRSRGKKVMVWTVNDEEDIEEFLQSNADMIITDEVSLSLKLKKELGSRKPEELLIEYIRKLFI